MRGQAGSSSVCWAACEYLINSHQDSGGFTASCCRTQTSPRPVQTKAMEHELWRIDHFCDTNRHAGDGAVEQCLPDLNSCVCH